MNTVAISDGLVVVHVCDQVNQTLAGHDGDTYTSPPHAPGDALALVGLLLGRPTPPDHDELLVWRCPVAGGQRTITLIPINPTSEGSR
jgi:hypothetical protein